MKSRLATILSIAGVLAAGSAAALVNTRALGGSGNGGDAPAIAAAATAANPADTAVPPVTAAATPSTASASSGPASSGPAETTPLVTTQSVFTVGDSGVVTVDRANGVLTLVAATPGDGWQIIKAESTTSVEVRVVFRSSTVEVTFTADLLDGGITTSVDAQELPGPGNATPSAGVTAPGTTSPHDDHGSEGGSDD